MGVFPDRPIKPLNVAGFISNFPPLKTDWVVLALVPFTNETLRGDERKNGLGRGTE